MKKVFADTNYWIALANPRDELHVVAREVSKRIGGVRLITTDEVLGEFVSHFRGFGPEGRSLAVKFVRRIMNNPNVQIEPQTRDGFLAGIDLYESRVDKEYSLADCISMVTMRRYGIAEVLTHDHHFEQDGFKALL